MTAQPLGAILAGGLSSRFGSDKAEARIAGVAMLDRVAARLSPQCAAVIVVGRRWPGLADADDLPAPGLGPLGGLAGALAYARRHGHATVLTSGCDLPDLPVDIAAMLGEADAIVADQPTIGLWRSDRTDELVDWIEAGSRRSIRAWAAHVGARTVAAPPILNVNRLEDLAAVRPPGGPRSSR